MLAGELGALHLVSAAEGLAGQAGKKPRPASVPPLLGFGLLRFLRDQRQARRRGTGPWARMAVHVEQSPEAWNTSVCTRSTRCQALVAESSSTWTTFLWGLTAPDPLVDRYKLI